MTNQKKILVLIFFILLLLIVSFIQFNKSTEAPTIPKNPDYTDAGIFKNNIFTFEYPEDLIAKDYNETSPWRTNTEVQGQFHVGILIPSSVEPNTNFREAKFTIGSSTDRDALADCLVPANGERAKGEVVINGTNFKKITLAEAGAGNYYDTVSYRTIHQGACYAVEHTIHSSNLRNYPPEQNIQEFNTPRIVEILEDMTKSFKFL